MRKSRKQRGTTIVEITPATPAVDVRILGGDSFVELAVEPGTEVRVAGYWGDDYLWFDGDGTVRRNDRSPSRWYSESRYGADVPVSLDLVAGSRRMLSDLFSHRTLVRRGHFAGVAHAGIFFTVASIDLEEEQSASAEGLQPETNRPKQPLEVFPLDTLAMVGIMEQLDNRWGLIKDPQNVVHRVKVGNYMGQNEGRIIEITETDIRLVEIIPDGIGGYIERDASIAIGNE